MKPLLWRFRRRWPRDLDDVSRILRRFRHQIDYAYLEPRLRELADALGRSEIIDLFQRESGRD